MKNTRFATLALTTAIALAAGTATWANTTAPTNTEQTPITVQADTHRGDRPHAERSERGPRGEHARDHHRAQGDHHHGHRQGPRDPLRSLDLSDAQKDKIFALRHAAAPELRQLAKTGADSRKALQEMAKSGQFDAAKAQALAKTAAEAQTQAIVLRTKLQADTIALLTPEQRAKLESQHKGGRHLSERPVR